MLRAPTALSLLLAALPAFAQQPGSVRLSQLRDSSDEVLVRRFFGEVRAFPYVGYRDRSAISSLRGRATLWFYSQAHATDRAGVCEAQWLIITLERVPASGRDDPLMQPRAFDLQPIFIIENRDEARRLSNPARRSPGEMEESCARLDPRRDGIPADYPFQLMKALELVEALGAGARAGRSIAPLDCSQMHWNGDPPVDEQACLRELAILRENQVGRVQDCAEAVVFETNCIRVQTWDWFIYFLYRPDQQITRIMVRGIEDTSAVE